MDSDMTDQINTSLASTGSAASGRTRVLIASNAADGNGILAYDWDSATGELFPAGIAAAVPMIDWLVLSPDRKYVYAAAELDSFNGKPTGEVASFKLDNGKLALLTARNSAGTGTCQLGLDSTGTMVVSADYGGGAAASFKVTDGKLSEPIWTGFFTGTGPNEQRQECAHAHFAAFSPDNRFVYINDLGSDKIYIFEIDLAAATLTPAGKYDAVPGSGPRTLHFHPCGETAYSYNELDSTIDLLAWDKASGSLTLTERIVLMPADYTGKTWGCDTIITRDGRFVYFVDRGDAMIHAFTADAKTGSLTRMGRSACGGVTPRHFTLDPTERWMLVANQNSDWVTVFARDPETGVVAAEGRSFAAATPMFILFV